MNNNYMCIVSNVDLLRSSSTNINDYITTKDIDMNYTYIDTLQKLRC